VTEFTLKEVERVWLISDTHFDHTNIIGYCNRPFASAVEMNSVLLQNWNDTIAPGDLVYFLGDMTYGRGSKGPRWWAAQLNGRKVWVKGSHDNGIQPTSVISGVERVVFNDVIACDGVEFILTHDGFGLNGWKGWKIQGHVHNNKPHIDHVWKHINVSVEVIGYKPVSLAQIVREVRSEEY